MSDEQAVAALARAFAHETCVRLVDALTLGEAAVTDLACRLGLEPPRISTHLALLREAGIVEVQARGRQRVYALRGRAPAMALATLRTLAAGVAGTGPRPLAATGGETDRAPIRLARTCYDHLAGVAGVALMDGLRDLGLIQATGGRGLRITGAGRRGLDRAGVDVEAALRSRRALAIECPDWTERRPHLGGALGAALLAALLEQDRARLRPGDRVVDMAAGEPAGFLARTAAGGPDEESRGVAVRAAATARPAVPVATGGGEERANV